MVQASDETEHPDLNQALQLFQEMHNNAQQVAHLVDNVILRVKSGDLTTEKGLSFLEMKYQMLLSYLINLTYIVLRKSSGERIEHDPAIERLVEIRTVLEKIRPIDSKLKYQVDKLCKTAAEGAPGDDDPQLFRPNPDNLVSKLNSSDENSSDESDGEMEKSRSNIYVPPKLAAVHYEDTTRVEAEKKLKERTRKQMLNSKVMKELREEYSEAPYEISSGNPISQIISKFEREKTEYEETYLTRLPTTKADKKRKRLSTIGVIADEIVGRNNSGGSKKRKFKSKKGRGFKKRRI